MIYIKNTQRTYSIDTEKLRNVLALILKQLKYEDFDISLWLTNNATIKIYNRDYREKDKATDVLSFPYQDVEAGKRIKKGSPDDRNLGDLIISVEYVDNQIKNKTPSNLESTLEKQIIKLLVHGVCHLLGYDHIEDEDWVRMRAKEGWLLKKIKEQNLF